MGVAVAAPVIGVFVGGRSSRMGTAKGRLLVPGTDETIIDTLVSLAQSIGAEPILVGDASAYHDLAPTVTRVEDDPPGAGPLAGLHAALLHATPAPLIAVACDMPFVSVEVLELLRDYPPAPVVAARRTDEAPWEPLLARYEPNAVLPVLKQALAGGVRSFQKLFDAFSVTRLQPVPMVLEALQDWDTPEDVRHPSD